MGAADAGVGTAGRRGLASLLALPALVVLAGCGDEGEAVPSPQGQGRSGGSARVVAVETTEVERGRIARTISVSGNVRPIRTVGVNSQLSGVLLELHVEEGDRVEEGEILALLDDAELAAQLRSAEANLEVSDAAYRRAERLRERQVVTEAEFERERAAYAAARAEVDQLRTRIARTRIRAPLTGIVTEKMVEAGDLMSAQSRLFTVADVSTMVVRVEVSELDVVELSAGDSVRVGLDAFPGEEFSGRVRRIFPSANPETRLVPVEVELDARAKERAREGFLARVIFELNPADGVLLVPASAVVRSAGGSGVYVVEEEIARFRRVTPGVTSGGMVAVEGELEAGDRVVLAGASQLREGAAVRDLSVPGRSDQEKRGSDR